MAINGPEFADETDDAVPLVAIAPDALSQWQQQADPAHSAWCKTNNFQGKIGEVLPIPDADGRLALVLVGMGDDAARGRTRFALAAGYSRLPKATYRPDIDLCDAALNQEALGLLLAQYAFTRYRDKPQPDRAIFMAPKNCDAPRLQAIAAGEFLTRDLINTPAQDMGPDMLEATARELADEIGATIEVTAGDDLLDRNFPMIHAVGRAASQAPRLIDMSWGATGPSLVLVGKGVCFDTGGLNLKPGSSMGLMKKDMGGAATVLGLARMIAALDLPIRLRVLIPAVENAVSGPAFRPGDILTSRKGLTVEVNNTDAEGRLVLADALALAGESPADLTVSMATLTGAARVAVGPDLAPFYAAQDADAAALSDAASRAADPVWRMPFWAPYEAMIEPGIADLDNAPSGGFAGSITAALFLRRFAPERYMHFDIYGWQPQPAPGRPKGGVGQGARALLDALPRLLDF